MAPEPILLGELSEFSPEIDVNMYIRHVEAYFALNKDLVAENQHSLLFLNAMGMKTFERVQCESRNKANEKTFCELKTILRNIFEPIHITQVERACFTNRKRLAGEPISDFVWQLKILAEHCKFGDTFDDRIKTQFIAGINSERILSKLLSLPIDSSLAVTVTKARETELIIEQSRLMTFSSGVSTNGINFVYHKDKQFSPHSPTSKARFSNFRSSNRYSPYFRSQKCFRCSREGHFARDCTKSRRHLRSDSHGPFRPHVCRASETLTPEDKILEGDAPVRNHSDSTREAVPINFLDDSDIEILNLPFSDDDVIKKIDVADHPSGSRNVHCRQLKLNPSGSRNVHWRHLQDITSGSRNVHWTQLTSPKPLLHVDNESSQLLPNDSTTSAKKDIVTDTSTKTAHRTGLRKSERIAAKRKSKKKNR